jgi:hypothetical protein
MTVIWELFGKFLTAILFLPWHLACSDLLFSRVSSGDVYKLLPQVSSKVGFQVYLNGVEWSLKVLWSFLSVVTSPFKFFYIVNLLFFSWLPYLFHPFKEPVFALAFPFFLPPFSFPGFYLFSYSFHFSPFVFTKSFILLSLVFGSTSNYLFRDRISSYSLG